MPQLTGQGVNFSAIRALCPRPKITAGHYHRLFLGHLRYPLVEGALRNSEFGRDFGRGASIYPSRKLVRPFHPAENISEVSLTFGAGFPSKSQLGKFHFRLDYRGGPG